MSAKSAGTPKGAVPPKPSATPKTIGSLPPDLIVRLISFLPVPDLPKVACLSRRFKILAYNEDLYEPKLKSLGVVGMGRGADEGRGGTGAAGTAGADTTENTQLVTRLRQLPGGHMLSGSIKYIGTGSLWGSLEEDSKSGTAGSPEQPAAERLNEAGSPDAPTPDSVGSPSSAQPQISAAITAPKKSTITIGAGGVHGAAKSQNAANIGGGAKSGGGGAGRQSRPARELFRQVYTELLPYFLDFKKRQKDSKVFKDFKDLVEVGTILRRLRLFSQAKFIPDAEDIDFSLETTIEWFESMVLGQFERAYDTNNIKEMQRNALAAYQLNGGAACAQLFISKNPIFFDETFNPSLVASKLPSAGGPAVGYSLADDFAKFSDYMLNNCRKQAEIIAQVFPPEMDVMTLFVNKVFEDSVAEYLTAVLVAAKSRENLGIYLHTLATGVHCCTQFVDFIANNEAKVFVQVDQIKANIATLFKPYTETYIRQEMEHTRKKFDAELDKWNNRKGERGVRKATAPYLADQEKAQAHKRLVMSAVKAVVFAPMALTKTLGITGNNRVKPHRQSLLGDAEPVVTPMEPERVDAVTYHLDDDSLNSLISLELCLNLMHTNKEALGRTLVITSATDRPKLRPNVEKVFCALLTSIGERHIKPAFDKAIDRLSKSQVVDSTGDKSVSMDSLQFFEMVHIADLIQQMVDVYFNEDVRSWVDETDFLSDIVVDKKAFEHLLDDCVAHGMDKAIQVLINQVDYILLTELSPTDYNPSDKAMVLDVKPTKACEKAIECLNSHTKLLSGATEKHTMEVFLGEVGVRLFNVIIKSIKRQQISQAGAMQLICDFNRYYQWAQAQRVSSIAKLFQVLKELGNLYLADGGEELKKLVHDQSRYQGALRIEEIYELLQSRTDYKKIQKYVESKECIIQ
ncbi:F-box protein: endocytic membrane traffic, recycling ReCYcling 1 [Borealophlyctis nickersoniae]|nr:F-box protein: endocytic membrane traffic, recycling ReCYcling 1 [Borealophlyctis nickersoniae]